MLGLLPLAFAVFAAVPMPPVAATAVAPRAATPAPCATNTAKANAATPCATPGLRKIGGAITVGRKADLVGKAEAASEGTISQEQIATRPILRPAEVLEAIPGLVVTQHSGEGKANQYYLRGFQLDHGTDLESTVFGIPVNLPTHAHGQGYSDVNYLIPELVSYVEFKKGPYYADAGDFSTAGSYNLFYRDSIAPITVFGLGDFGYDRFMTAASPKVGKGNLLYALELYHNNGTFDKYGEYHKLNGVLRYSQTKGANDFAVTGIAYNGSFGSSDQIPQRLVDEGVLDKYGYFNPSDAGNTYRYAMSTQFTHHDERGDTKFNAYGVRSFLDLFSDFSYDLDDATDYYNLTKNPITCNASYVSCNPSSTALRTQNYTSYCPANNSAPAAAPAHSVVAAPFTFACGDQREQLDSRVYAGFDLSRSFKTAAATTTFGIGLRNDNVPEVGLFRDNDRVRYANGTLSEDHVVERSAYAYLQTDIRVGSRLRLGPALRFDSFGMNVAAPDPNNSGYVPSAMVNPKMTLAYKISPKQEFYGDFGESYHSNDARGVIGLDDLATHKSFDATGAAVLQDVPLTRASGYEFGYRYATPKDTTTVSYYSLLLANELVFDGDSGTTAVGGPTLRRGIELTNFFTPTRWLTFDGDFATATARFLADPDRVGTGVPESLNTVISGGITLDKPHYTVSLRGLYFGPRTLDTQGDAVSPETTTLNGLVVAKLGHGVRITADVLNLLNYQGPDVTYYYNSWTPYDATPANRQNPLINPALGGVGIPDYHFHPEEKRTLRITFSTQQ